MAVAEPTTPSGALALLRDAAEAGATVLIGYVDNHGASSERLVDPLRVEAGQLTAHDHRSDDTRTFAIHRITAVRPASAVTPCDRRTVMPGGLPQVRRRLGAPRQHPAARRGGAARAAAVRDWLQPQCTRPGRMLLRKFQRELRPVFEASARGEVGEVTGCSTS